MQLKLLGNRKRTMYCYNYLMFDNLVFTTYKTFEPSIAQLREFLSKNDDGKMITRWKHDKLDD